MLARSTRPFTVERTVFFRMKRAVALSVTVFWIDPVLTCVTVTGVRLSVGPWYPGSRERG